LDAAYRAAQGLQGGSKRAAGCWTPWYEANEWRKRAEAYDAYLERKTRGEAEGEHVKQIKQYRERARQSAAMGMSLGMLVLQKCLARIKALSGDGEDVDMEQVWECARIGRYGSYIIMATASTMEASALGVDELLKVLEPDVRDERP
jgi:hypothetical protein